MMLRKTVHVAVIAAMISTLGLLGGCGTKARTEEDAMMKQRLEQSAQRADQAATRAEQAADRADQSATRAEQAADRATQMADKAEKIFNKKMKK